MKTAKFDFKKAKIERRENDYYIFAKSDCFAWDFYHLIVGDISLCWHILGSSVAGAQCLMSYPLFCAFCMADTPPISFAQKVCKTGRLGCANILLLLQMLWQVCTAQKHYLTQAVCEIIVLLVFQSTHQGRLWFQLACLAFSRRFLAFQSLILSHLWAFLCLAICFHRHLKLNLPR